MRYKWTKFIKNAKKKNGQFLRVFENLKLADNSVTRQVNFNRTKMYLRQLPKRNFPHWLMYSVRLEWAVNELMD